MTTTAKLRLFAALLAATSLAACADATSPSTDSARSGVTTTQPSTQPSMDVYCGETQGWSKSCKP